MKRWKLMTGSAALAAAVAAPVLALSRSHGDGASSTGQRINAGIDNLLATGVRLLDVPAFMLLSIVAIIAFAAVVITHRMLRGSPRGWSWGRAGLITGGLVVLFGLALAADRHAQRLEKDIAALRARINAIGFAAAPEPTMPPIPPVAAAVPPVGAPARATPGIPLVVANTVPPSPLGPAAPTVTPAATASVKRTAFLFDPAAARKALAPFGTVTLRPIVFDQATDAVAIHMDNPLVQAYAAIIDLKTPGLAINWGGALTQKTLTTAFAKQFDCSVAINGEAGDSPQMNSGLGEWHGHYMTQGQTLLKEDPANRRPFLSFTRDNAAAFTPLASLDRALRADAYNVVWGRMDSLINDELQTGAERDRQPRTAMGLSADNTKLILLVVDGRQQQYSLGLTRGEVGMVLRAFGANNGMLCDEGGSSIMIFKGWGIVNSPSDGEERATYTHFGISLKPGT